MFLSNRKIESFFFWIFLTLLWLHHIVGVDMNGNRMIFLGFPFCPTPIEMGMGLVLLGFW